MELPQRMGKLISADQSGYDLVLLGSFCKSPNDHKETVLLTLSDAYPEFVQRFGVLGADGTYQIPAPWQAGLGNGASVGEIFGLIVSLLFTRQKRSIADRYRFVV
jgi:hypothetical protein